ITIQKPTNFKLQKLCYSGKNKNNSVVAYSIVACNGTIIDILPIFGSNGHNNDETIFNATTDTTYLCDAKNNKTNIFFERIKDVAIISKLLKYPNDGIIFDKGYSLVKKPPWKIWIPQSMSKDEKQLPTDKANETRRVTMIRNVVERCFSRLKKKWKILNEKINNRFIYILTKLLRVLAA